MIKVMVEIVNKRGLHARAAASFVDLACAYESQIWLGPDEENMVSGKDILKLMALAASRGAKLQMHIKGEDEKQAAQALEALIAGGFYETN